MRAVMTLSIPAFLYIGIPSYGQDYFHTKKSTVVVQMPLEKTVITAQSTDLEIILDVMKEQLWLGIHVNSLQTGIKKWDRKLFKKNQKAFIIKGNLNYYPTKSLDPNISLFSFQGAVLDQGPEDIIIGSGQIEWSRDNHQVNISVTVKINSKWFGSPIQKVVNDNLVELHVSLAALQPLDSRNSNHKY